MAQAHLGAGVLFSNGIKDHFSTAEDFWVAEAHVVYGKLQSPPLRGAFKNIFSKSFAKLFKFKTNNTNMCLFC